MNYYYGMTHAGFSGKEKKESKEQTSQNMTTYQYRQ